MAGKRLSDEEKKTLILFYKENPPLWDGTHPQNKCKRTKEELKVKLVAQFDDLYQVDTLEKSFHSLRTSFLRELKKKAEHAESQEKDVPLRKWKFMDEMEFLTQEINREKKKTNFSDIEIEELIEFYRDNPALWNHLSKDWRDRTLRGTLMEKLHEHYESKYTIDEIKQAWHNTLTQYKSEKLREDASKTKSGSGLSEVYISKWQFFDSMEFIDITCGMDETVNTIESNESESTSDPPPPAKKKSKAQEKSEERAAKIDLWKTIAQTMKAPLQPQQLQATVQQPAPVNQPSNLEARANLFGKLVADNLLQCDPNDWTYLKKKVMDLFFDYEQRRASLATYEIRPGTDDQDGPFTALLQSTDPVDASSSYSNNSSF